MRKQDKTLKLIFVASIRKHYLYANEHLRDNIKAGLVTRTIWKNPHFYTLPSQFPNDRLSPTDIKTFDAYTDSYRRGFSPRSLFTGYVCLQHNRHSV